LIFSVGCCCKYGWTVKQDRLKKDKDNLKKKRKKERKKSVYVESKYSLNISVNIIQLAFVVFALYNEMGIKYNKVSEESK